VIRKDSDLSQDGLLGGKHSGFGVPRLTCALILAGLVLAGCGNPTQAPAQELVDVHATSAAWPWLAKVCDCAPGRGAIIRISAPEDADVRLRVGEPEFLASPAFQIDTEDVLVVVHAASPVRSLSQEEARLLFAGQGDPSIPVWVFSAGEDIQQIFDAVVMSGGNVTARARVAGNTKDMSDAINADQAAVGILPRHSNTADLREVLVVASAPVLAITATQPVGVLRDLLACLQK